MVQDSNIVTMESPGDFVLDGDPTSLPKMGVEPLPQFSANFYCAQTAGCTMVPLGVEVGLSPGDFVFDGDQEVAYYVLNFQWHRAILFMPNHPNFVSTSCLAAGEASLELHV